MNECLQDMILFHYPYIGQIRCYKVLSIKKHREFLHQYKMSLFNSLFKLVICVLWLDGWTGDYGRISELSWPPISDKQQPAFCSVQLCCEGGHCRDTGAWLGSGGLLKLPKHQHPGPEAVWGLFYCLNHKIQSVFGSLHGISLYSSSVKSLVSQPGYLLQ